MHRQQISTTRLLIALACLVCGACDRPLTVPAHEQRGISFDSPHVSSTPAERRYLDGTEYFFGEFREGETWYVCVEMNARENDPRSNAELLDQCLQLSRANQREDVRKLVEHSGGKAEFAEIIVFRDKSAGVGRFVLGMIVPLKDFLDSNVSDQEILEAYAVFSKPVVARDGDWYHAMVWAHRAGTFQERK